MKSRLLLAIVFVLCQALVLTGGVSAQGPEPPATPLPGGPFNQHAPVRNPANQPGAASTVPLGQPGTSFRYVQTFGVTEQAYPTDVQHLNQPYGLFVDSGDNLFVVESVGRLLKYSSTGTNLLSIGNPGTDYNGDYNFASPQDAAVDSSGNIWVVDNHRAAEYSSTGTHLQDLPSADPWQNGSDNGHFDSPNSIAFDSAGRLYVSDWNNQRVQVFSFSGNTPVYSTTIGVTGVTGTDNNHFNLPARMAFDGLGRLYVADDSNQRIQRCTYAGGWTCTTFFGVSGISGSDLTHLNNPWSVAFGPGNVTYIADQGNSRILKCNATPTCAVFAGVTGVPGADNAHFAYPKDVAVDSAGNVYVADMHNFRVQKFNSVGTYQSTLGITGVPYIPDTSRFYGPFGITVTSDGSLYFTENRGHRAIKLNAAGVEQWTYGVAGVYLANGADNAHLGVWWGGVEGSPAVDASGHVYVPDTGNSRIQILDSSGHYLSTFGAPGGGDNQFSGPGSVFIRPSTGDIYVADQWNQRIQVFDSNRVYKATLGVTGVSGTDSTHFNFPGGVAVDAAGDIFVADTGNYRVQKCSLNGSTGNCATFAGQTGVPGSDFSHFQHPVAVAVDSAGRVYVADSSNERVQVFDSSGGYLTTLGGQFGPNSGQLRNPMGVAVDSANNVYVADFSNERIQKYALGVPGWTQANLNGFGDVNNKYIASFSAFGGQLYAGTFNYAEGASLWRSPDGHTWTQAGAPNLTSGATSSIPTLQEFNGQLYAGTGWSNSPGQLWRSANGTTWTAPVTDGFGDSNNVGIVALAVFSGTFYAGTYNNTTGVQLWRSSTGDSLSWTNVMTAGFDGDVGNYYITNLVQFGGYLYATSSNHAGAEVWRSANGTQWDQVNADGFGSADNYEPGGFAILNGYAYISTRNDVSGAQLFRSSTGASWDPIALNGFGNVHNQKIQSMVSFNGALYGEVDDNQETGLTIWRSTDGTNWTQISLDGWGDVNTIGASAGSLYAFNNHLFAGAGNFASGGKVWELLNQLYLPLVRR